MTAHLLRQRIQTRESSDDISIQPALCDPDNSQGRDSAIRLRRSLLPCCWPARADDGSVANDYSLRQEINHHEYQALERTV